MTKTHKSNSTKCSTETKKAYKGLLTLDHGLKDYMGYLELEGLPVNDQGEINYHESIFMAGMMEQIGKELEDMSNELIKQSKGKK